MCTPDEPCALLSFAEARAITAWIVAGPCWSGPPVYVMADPYGPGSQRGRFVRYSRDGVRSCVVIHELAHVGCPDRGHGPEWSARAATLLRCLDGLR